MTSLPNPISIGALHSASSREEIGLQTSTSVDKGASFLSQLTHSVALSNTEIDSASAPELPLPPINGQSIDLNHSATKIEPTSDSIEPMRQGTKKDPTKEAFQNFVGQTFFSQLISSMRSTQQESAYFNGGRAEKIFQGQLDQILSEEMTKASASQIADPMFKLFQLQRGA